MTAKMGKSAVTFFAPNNRDGKNAVIRRHPLKKGGVFSMSVNVPHSKPPPKRTRWVSPAERAWLDHINRQLAYDEYMQAKRELWLAERPSAQRDERRETRNE